MCAWNKKEGLTYRRAPFIVTDQAETHGHPFRRMCLAERLIIIMIILSGVCLSVVTVLGIYTLVVQM